MTSLLLRLLALQSILLTTKVSGTLPTRKGMSKIRQSTLHQEPFMKSSPRQNFRLFGIFHQKRINRSNNNRAPPFIIIKDLQRLSCLRGGGDILEPSSMEDLQEVLQTNSDKLVVIDFYNDNCEPCQRIAPLFNAMSKGREFADKVIFVKVHVTQTPDITAHYGVTGWPTFLFLQHGEMQTEIVGGKLAEATLYDWIKLLMPKEEDDEEEEDDNNSNEPQSATVEDTEQEDNAGRDDDSDGQGEEMNLDDSNNSSG